MCWTTTLSRFCHISCAISVATQKTCRHRSGRPTGCNSVKQPFQYHDLLHRSSQYFRREPANVDPLNRTLALSVILPQEFGNCGASYTLSLHPATQPRGDVLAKIAQCPRSLYPFRVAAETHFFIFSEKADVQGQQRSKC